jgi:hypothetical protein
MTARKNGTTTEGREEAMLVVGGVDVDCVDKYSQLTL